jgi:hypothetical protein
MLKDKSLTQLRGIGQSYGLSNIFQKDANQLRQEIEDKQQAVLPKQEPIPKPEYDARLMTKIPSKRSPRQEAEELLAPYVKRGLHVSYDDECWYMKFGVKDDSGTLRMPLRVLLSRADMIMGK